jgi:hypothetical protein
MNEEAQAEALKLLNKLFVYKAEWLGYDMFKLYTQPSYFPEITGVESCVLIGGRGTGKTTVLKELSYSGQYIQSPNSITDNSYIGLYYKVESNKMSAFSASGKSDTEWIKPFAHYVNLILISLIADMLLWLEENNYVSDINFDDYKWKIFKQIFESGDISNFTELKMLIQRELNHMENYINNNIHAYYNFTILGGPFDALIEALISLNFFQNKNIFILFDEYENFSKYQQEVVNTLIKQASGKKYSFKIGVRELGWKSRVTLNNQELRSPSDYRKIEIQSEMEAGFEKFATSVCEGRLLTLFKELGIDEIPSVKNLFLNISVEDEAEMLGILEVVAKSPKYNQVSKKLSSLHPFKIWFLCEWLKKCTPTEIVLNYKKDQKGWDVRYDNYKYAMLFAVRDKKVGIRKFYSGWNTLVLMAGSNIRFMLQLVEFCLKIHILEGNSMKEPITVANQTKAAFKVGLSNFEELEGLDVNGNFIMKLLQGLGRIFELLAKHPIGHAPEVNQFSLSEGIPSLKLKKSVPLKLKINDLIDLSISHLALRRSISTKLSQNEPRAFDYSIHPIYSALFQISHRKKRKLSLNLQDIEALINNPKTVIDKIMQRHNRANLPDADLDLKDVTSGTQLRLFD